LEEVYKTSDVVYGGDGLPGNVRRFGKGVPFPDDDGPAGSYYIDFVTGAVGPARASVPPVYYCPSRRRPDLYSWNRTNLTDYCAVAPGMVPMLLDSAGYSVEDTGGLIYGWARTEGNFNGRPGFNDWQYGRHHGVIPGGNWGNQHQKHTFADITDGVNLTMMIGEKFLRPSQYSGGSGGDGLGPFSGAGADTVRTSATGFPWPDDARPPQALGRHENPSRDRDNVDGWVFAMGFGSAHPPGCNVVFADGSVHNIKYGIDAQVFNALGNMNDGTTLETTGQ
jgi:prepilin-type processing-associated H-X9-DG protein